MEFEEKIERKEKDINRKVNIYWIIPALLFIFFVMMVYSTSGFQNGVYKVKSWVSNDKTTTVKTLNGIERLELRSQNNITDAENKLDKLLPAKPYIVINTTDNRFSLRKANGDTIRTGFCSTGKDNILIKGDKKWVFKTPKGLFTVQNKRTSPVWTKPDWAFIEEGLPVPSARSSERYDPNTMGDYALGLGDGYFIHGTLYQRFIGLPVTHGCVRIGDKDLEVIYNTLSVGSKVFIY
jgi:lipoprotein-anchoring transpeptidase ErfK/SrfK